MKNHSRANQRDLPIQIILYYFFSFLTSLPGWATQPSLPDNLAISGGFSPTTIAAVRMAHKGVWLETKDDREGKVSYIVGIPFRYIIPACAPLVLQKSTLFSNHDLPAAVNPSRFGVMITTTVDLPATTQMKQVGQKNDCLTQSQTTQLIKVLIRGNSTQKLFGTVLQIPMVPPGKGSEDMAWKKVLILFSPAKQKVEASFLEELPPGYMATYLKLAMLQGKL